ncbi:MAG: hypothetical protein QNJ74_06195 [Trichodesmium sp. MO_231.B1]|nr:hypothetical protein [Trichodesmium sp. MO_231.B1]
MNKYDVGTIRELSLHNSPVAIAVLGRLRIVERRSPHLQELMIGNIGALRRTILITLFIPQVLTA